MQGAHSVHRQAARMVTKVVIEKTRKERDSLSAMPGSVRDIVLGPDQAVRGQDDVATKTMKTMTELDVEADGAETVKWAHHTPTSVGSPEPAAVANVRCT